jgi:hypothetical protein
LSALQRARPEGARQLGRDPAQRVHPRVGAPGAGDAHRRVARQAAERRLQLALHRARGGTGGPLLRLPAREVAAVVGEGQAIQGHGERQRIPREPGFMAVEPAAHSGQASAA